MNRWAGCLCRCRQLTRPHSRFQPFLLRCQPLGHARFFSTRQLHTDTPISSAMPSLRPSFDEHIEPELASASAVPTASADYVTARIDRLLATRHELDAVMLFQRNRHLLPLSRMECHTVRSRPQASPAVSHPPAAIAALIASVHQPAAVAARFTRLVPSRPAVPLATAGCDHVSAVHRRGSLRRRVAACTTLLA